MKTGRLVLVSIIAALAVPSVAWAWEGRAAFGLLPEPADVRSVSAEVPGWSVQADSEPLIRFAVRPVPAFYAAPGAVAFLHGGNDQNLTRASQLIAPPRDRLLTVRYDWRGITLEGATVSMQEEEGSRQHEDRWRLRSSGARLSLHPLPGLVLRFSRGTWNQLDRLVSGGEMRRTSLSATYTQRLTGGEWQTTFAWGRNAPSGREAVYGYLAESSIRFAGDHLAFGRLEQVGTDELVSRHRNLSSWVHPEHVRKASLGYYQDLLRSRAGRLGVGLMASRYLVPHAYSAFLENSTVYMLFMRVDMH